MMRGKNETLDSWKKRLAKRSKAMRKRPGSSWRIRTVGRSTTLDVASSKSALKHLVDTKSAKTLVTEKHVFDELAIDDWFHLEQMDDRVWWLNVGDRGLVVWIHIPHEGPPKIKIEAEPPRRTK